MDRQFGRASVQYNDWRGTVALDNPDDPALEEIVGLDPQEWSVCGLEVFGTYGDSWGAVLAVRSADLERAGNYAALANEHGGRIPVMRFAMPETTGIELLRAFKRWTVHAVWGHGTDGVDLVVTGDQELPYPQHWR